MTAEGGTVEAPEASTPDDVVRAAMALGLFGGTRLFVVEEPGSAWSDKGAPQALAGLGDYLDDPTEATVIVVVADETLAEDAPLARLAGPGQLRYDRPAGKELFPHARREAKRLGLHIDADALRRVLELSGDAASRVDVELDRLATWAAGEPVTAELVDELVWPTDAATPFVLTDSLSGRDLRRLLRALLRTDRAGDVAAVVPQLARHVELLRRARQALDQRDDYRTFARRAGIHEFRARKLLDAAVEWSQPELTRVAVALARVDHAAKGGVRLDPRFSLELALAATVPRSLAKVQEPRRWGCIVAAAGPGLALNVPEMARPSR